MEVRTRSGRVSKPPERYEPQEVAEDDYDLDDYDESESELDSDIEYSDEEFEDEDEGSLKDFVESDKSESEEDSNGSCPVVPVKKRGVPAAAGIRRPRGQSASPSKTNAFPSSLRTSHE